VWAPRATAVYLYGTFSGTTFNQPTDDRLMQNVNGFWGRLQVGAQEGSPYTFFIVGLAASGTKSPKRDPRARELDSNGFPNCNSIVCDANVYRWHDGDFRSPDFSEMVIISFTSGFTR
jgi:1,4-alpha-glucan branching enzyme